MKSTIHIDNIFLEDEKNIQPKVNLNTSTNLLKKYILFIIYTTFVINIYNLDEQYKMKILIIYPIISYILNFYDTRLPILDNMLNGFYNIVCLFITPYYTYSRKQIIENPSLLSLPRSKYLHYCKSCKKKKIIDQIIVKTRDGYDMKVAVTTTALTTKTDDKCGIIFYFHGGGMCVGTAQDGMNLYFEGRNGYIVVCPSYRMAPEFKFPYSPNDCFDCVKYFINNNNNNNDSIKKKYNIDISKICLVGTSAGGGLSAAVAIECKRNNIPITCTSLLIPMLAPPCTESYQTNSRLSTLLSCDTMLWFWRMYASPKDYTNPLCAPLFASDETLKDFPTTFLYTGTMDVLRDEGVLFGERLRKLGIKVKQIQAVGTHVGCLLSNPSILQKFIDSIFDYLEKQQ